MTTLVICFGGALLITGLVLAVSVKLLLRPLRSVLTDLLGSAPRAQFFSIALCGLLITITLAGSLLPADLVGLSVNDADTLALNASKQFLTAGCALLVGLGAAACLLLVLIHKFEARRA